LASVSAPALKLSLYFNETLRSDGDLACDRLLDLFERANVKASVLLRGIEGFGAHHRLHTERLENASLNQPLIAIAIDREERIAALLPRVDEVLESGLVTTERGCSTTRRRPRCRRWRTTPSS
jgi:PII-like signaling protein